jgi:hypothetical protein
MSIRKVLANKQAKEFVGRLEPEHGFCQLCFTTAQPNPDFFPIGIETIQN